LIFPYVFWHSNANLFQSCGSGGIGHALSIRLRENSELLRPRLHQPAYQISCTDVQVISTLLPHESAEHLLSRGVHVVRTDVTKDNSVQELKEFIKKLTGGRLDILINNA